MSVSSFLILRCARLAATLQVTAAEDMAATGEIEPCHKAFFRVDSIRQTMNGLLVTFVYIGEGSATYGAGVDEVEGSSTQLR